MIIEIVQYLVIWTKIQHLHCDLKCMFNSSKVIKVSDVVHEISKAAFGLENDPVLYGTVFKSLWEGGPLNKQTKHVYCRLLQGWGTIIYQPSKRAKGQSLTLEVVKAMFVCMCIWFRRIEMGIYGVVKYPISKETTKTICNCCNQGHEYIPTGWGRGGGFLHLDLF